jgi:predicted acetyltransferase
MPTKMKDKKIQKVEITMQEIWNASKPAITKNKKKYNRKTKHKSNESKD